MNRREGLEVAQRAAWSEFGSKHWRWFVYRGLILRAVGLALLVGAGWLALRWVAQTGWLWWVLGGALGAVVYTLAAVLVWRLCDWRLIGRGWSRGGYVGAVMLFGVVTAIAIGVFV